MDDTLNGINREELINEFSKYDNEVHDAVKKREYIDTKGKEIELLRYLQKVAEYRRLYYQWLYPKAIFVISTVSAFFLSISLDIPRIMMDSNRIVSPNYLVLDILIFFLLVAIVFMYKIYIYKKFDACHNISIGIEREIQVSEMMKKMEKK